MVIKSVKQGPVSSQFTLAQPNPGSQVEVFRRALLTLTFTPIVLVRNEDY
jgi:hypothetical protein